MVFSKVPNYKESIGVWRWTYNGLGWNPGLYDDNTYTIAITNDGRINADFISTGTLIADIIKAGILTDQNENHNFWFNISTGEYQIRALDELIEDSQYFVTLTQLNQTASSIEATAAATYATIDTANGLATRLATAESNISINATNITSKVSLTDYTGATIASKINQSATSVVIEAAHISLAGKTIALTSDNIAISSTNFSVSKDGTITAKAGTIGGFTIDATSIRSAALTSTASGAVGISTADFTRAIGGTNRSGLRLAIGSNFAVGSTGSLYATDAVIKGTVTATTLSSSNAQITGGYFRVTTSSSDYSAIEINYGSNKSVLRSGGLTSSSGSYTSSLTYSGVQLTYSVVRGIWNYNKFELRNSSSVARFKWDGTNITVAYTAHGDLAGTGNTATNSSSKAVPNDSITAVMSVTIPSAGVWVISAGARFPSNSVGRRVGVLSYSSGSWSETDYGNMFSIPAVNGSWTEGSICKVVTTTGSQVFYLNAYQNSGQSLTVYASIRAVRIA